jgi:cold shock CspA family protein
MRDQGRLVEWFDDKGYGFIQPNDKHKDRVFYISKTLLAQVLVLL